MLTPRHGSCCAIQYIYSELLDSSKQVLVKRCVYILDQAKRPALNFLILTPM
jgi:hypothetical protein